MAQLVRSMSAHDYGVQTVPRNKASHAGQRTDLVSHDESAGFSDDEEFTTTEETCHESEVASSQRGAVEDLGGSSVANKGYDDDSNAYWSDQDDDEIEEICFAVSDALLKVTSRMPCLEQLDIAHLAIRRASSNSFNSVALVFSSVTTLRLGSVHFQDEQGLLALLCCFPRMVYLHLNGVVVLYPVFPMIGTFELSLLYHCFRPMLETLRISYSNATYTLNHLACTSHLSTLEFNRSQAEMRDILRICQHSAGSLTTLHLSLPEHYDDQDLERKFTPIVSLTSSAHVIPTVWDHSDFNLCAHNQLEELKLSFPWAPEDGLWIHLWLSTVPATCLRRITLDFMKVDISRWEDVDFATIDHLVTHPKFGMLESVELHLPSSPLWYPPAQGRARQYADLKQCMRKTFRTRRTLATWGS